MLPSSVRPLNTPVSYTFTSKAVLSSLVFYYFSLRGCKIYICEEQLIAIEAGEHFQATSKLGDLIHYDQMRLLYKHMIR